MRAIWRVLAAILLAGLIPGCELRLLKETQAVNPTPVNRYALIPAGVSKITPAEDAWIPTAAAGWSQPAPLPFPVNTAGAEDSPFILEDDVTLLFFFTPDLNIPAEKQLLDGVTGIWVTRRQGEGWSEPQRLMLARPGEMHLDGCPFINGSLLVFCSARQGNYRDIDLFTAEWNGNEGSNWKNWGEQINRQYRVGEMHISKDGSMLYFSSDRAGGWGGRDLWVSRKQGEGWGEPVNLGAQVNSSQDENRPFLSADGNELWFDRPGGKGKPGTAIFRSLRQKDGSWSIPEEIVSIFAGEPTLTSDGKTLFFVHHYVSKDGSKIYEADVYFSRR
ncbi:MAG TPA: hypothetical protein VIO61_05175 [Anaerolineaceae bacterium]